MSGLPSASILLGNGDGAFQSFMQFDVGIVPWGNIAVADIGGHWSWCGSCR